MPRSKLKRRIVIHEYVTGGGLAGQPLPASWAAEGGAMRRVLAADFAAVPGLEVVVTLDHRLRRRDCPGQVVRIGPGEELPILARLAAGADFTLVIAPETRAILQDRAIAVEQAGGRWLGCAPESIALVADKDRLGRHLAERGIPAPASVRINPARGAPAGCRFPAVLKPVDGAGCLDTYYVAGPDRWPTSPRLPQIALLQPFVAGQPMSATFLVDADGAPWLLCVGLQRIERRGNRLVYRGGLLPVEPPEQIGVVTQAVAAVPGLRGFVGVDIIWNERDGTLWVVDVNPRATTSCVGLCALLPPGLLAEAWLEAMRGPSARALARLGAGLRGRGPVCFGPSGKVRLAKGHLAAAGAHRKRRHEAMLGRD